MVCKCILLQDNSQTQIHETEKTNKHHFGQPTM